MRVPLLPLLAMFVVGPFIPSPSPAKEVAAPYRAVEEVLTARSTVVGEPLRYPEGEAEVHAVVITLRPGEETARHVHPAPLFAYVLEGELAVDYGAHGKRTYRAGDALLEAMQVPHRGKNVGAERVRILAVFLGAAGTAASVPAD